MTTSKNEASPARDGKTLEFVTGEGEKIALFVPRRVKRAKLARAINARGAIAVLDFIFTPEENEALDNLPLTPDEWEDLQNQIVDLALGVASPKS
jgi:hypothetical protein